MVLEILNYKKGVDDAFACECIPYVLSVKMRALLLEKDASKMDGFLKAMYGVSTKHVVDVASKSIKPYWFGGDCQIRIDPTAYDPKSNQRVEPLMKLVDSGNTEVKGLGILRDAIAYVSNNIDALYGIYLRGNEMTKKEGR